MSQRRRAASAEEKVTIQVTETELAEIRAGVRLRNDELTRAEKYMTDRGLPPEAIHARLAIIRGDGPTRPGLFAVLGFRDTPDPNQLTIEDAAEEEK